ncbi:MULTISPECIES: signal recognition particle-docking protein FtsY [Providencia]|uniref:signal recognition particle-docking protein FtsY n=4 Tax=Morganellaceae TaxID=1903414 RepID=UPI00197F08AE|nr:MULTISPECIES: signal recognition particle-docking protein FtsY [Providencia]MBN4864559.1 signal recognition particle-docking protein FtsY [Providencia stuartii]MBN4873994.1 signal recognition particle-docking protein FtsY [Providencia stuartii]MBN4878685.1 signal recognition particle-docking protein FtsY [Providencia stuartii]MBN4883082.1 signal recognition particle-docking protein FtsY [Providencia stuartii]
MAKDKKKGFFSWLGFGRKDEEETQKQQAQQEEAANEVENQHPVEDAAASEAERQYQAEQAAIKAAEDEAERQYEAQQAAIEAATEQAELERKAQLEAIQAAQEQAERERFAAEEARLAEEKAERDRQEEAAQRLAEEELERQREAELAAVKAAEDAAEQQRQADLAAIKAAEDKAERELQEAARLAEEQAEQERQAAEAARLAEEQAEQERQAAEAARLAEEQAEQERQAAEAARLAEEQAEQERQAAEAARLAEEQAEQERQAAEAARLAEEQAEQERQAAEAARLAEEQAEQERQAAEAVRLAEEQAEQERQAAEAARLAEEQAEQERQAAEAARLAEEQAEQERQAAEAARLAEEEAEAERLRLEEEKNSLSKEQEKPKKEGFFARLKKGLLKTRQNLGSGFLSLFTGKKIDDDLFDELEEQLLIADVGVETTRKIIDNLTAHASRKDLKDAEALYGKLREEMSDILAKVDKPLVIEDKKPYVILMVGVNGVGKTTTIGKLARQYQSEGKSVMLAAGDTFRAAAVEQLQVWGERNKIAVVAQHTGADPASVIFDAIQSAQAKGVDVLIADTAGRLQNKSHLMEELKKIVRVMKKLDESAPHEIMLTLDASTGQNAVSQAKLFDEAVGLTGITLTKLDGTAKGGVIFSIADQFGIPIRYIGIGEGIEDLRPFKADDFIEALFAREE